MLYREDDMACIEVSDNGAGMDAEVIDRVLARKSGGGGSENPEEKSVGLANVLSRLDIFYDRKEEVDIRSTPGEGTSVIIRMPVEKEELCTK